MTAPRHANESELGLLRKVAEEAAALGSDMVRRQFAGHATAGELKGVGDYVTAVDRESEEAIRSLL